MYRQRLVVVKDFKDFNYLGAKLGSTQYECNLLENKYKIICKSRLD